MIKPDTAFPRDAEFLDYIRSFVDESRLSGAAVDRLFALARRGAEASEESNLRGMVRHHQDQTTALRAEVKKLKADLAYADSHAAKVEDLLWGTAKENERLRAALWDIHAICNNGPFVWAKRIRAIARAALEGRT